jgi:hypothetical protein
MVRQMVFRTVRLKERSQTAMVTGSEPNKWGHNLNSVRHQGSSLLSGKSKAKLMSLQLLVRTRLLETYVEEEMNLEERKKMYTATQNKVFTNQLTPCFHPDRISYDLEEYTAGDRIHIIL